MNSGGYLQSRFGEQIVVLISEKMGFAHHFFLRKLPGDEQHLISRDWGTNQIAHYSLVLYIVLIYTPKTQRLFIFGGSRWWLVGSVCMTFSRHLVKAYMKLTAHCHHQREQNVFVCAFIASVGLLCNIVTLNHSYCIQTYTRSWQAFLEQFWLRWFSPLCTYWGQVY